MDCSMSCCHAEAHAFVAAIVFVLPPTLLLSHLPLLGAPIVIHSERPTHPAIAPPDRPPRLLPS